MINILKTNRKKFNWIIQIADIHIKLTPQRHSEYREVFNNLYNEIKNSPDDTIVVCCGDTLHNKLDLSPESVQLASELFSNIANLRPFILISGNHDQNLSNKNRLDSLSPIVDALNNPNLFYLKQSGLYGIGNLLFNNMSIIDSPEKYILGKDIPQIYKNQYEHIISLFHGVVDGVSTETGYRLTNPQVMIPLFDKHHISLCGDIHLEQNMQEYIPDENKPCIRYCGSLLQNNHGEFLKGHGYSLWNLKTRTYIHKEIKNDYGYYTIDIDEGKLISDIKDLPLKTRLRVNCHNTIPSEVKEIISVIREKTEILETSYIRIEQETNNKNIIPLCKDIIIGDLNNIEYQNKLIVEFLQKKLILTDQSKIDEIIKINKQINSLIKREKPINNFKWRLIKLEWSNMFSYGEDNIINFENINGVYGIIGKNALGKSNIFSALIFCLFDKFERGSKGLSVLNVQKTTFQCKIEFEIDGIRYFIERKGVCSKLGNVKVDVRFWKITGGVDEELHGTDRRDTNDIIRDYIGSYDDFILTSASFQNVKNNTSFIDIGNAERKDLLVRFMGLNIFDILYELSNERNKEINILLKQHKNKNYNDEIQQNQSVLDTTNTLFDKMNKEVGDLKKQIIDVNEQTIIETGKLIKLDKDVPSNISLLESRKESAENVVSQKRKFNANIKEILINAEKQLADINYEIKKLEDTNLIESHKTYNNLAIKVNEWKQKIDIKRVDVKGKLEKVARLDKHKYDPNCKFCVDNSFVKDAIKAKSELVNDKKETNEMMAEFETAKAEISKYAWVEKSYETYTSLLSKRNLIKDDCASSNKTIIISTNELEKLVSAYNSIIQQIDLYHKNEISLNENNKTQLQIATFRLALSNIDIEYKKKNQQLMDISNKIVLYKSQIEMLVKIISQIKDLEYELELYQYYTSSVGRDGIPYQVICNAVPEIEKEVNSLLSQVVDFTIQFETDGKNIIPYIVYTDKGKWGLELSSGYEKFVSSIAIRVALSNLSHLNKNTGLYIDEGFSTLDPENLASMSSLFTVLRSLYDYVIVISHNDIIKDAVDKIIEITRETGFSKVVYE